MTFVAGWHALLGGLLIGAAAAILLLGSGRIAGISGIVGGALSGSGWKSEGRWRYLFLVGLVGTGALLARLFPSAFPTTMPASAGMLMGAGLLVGFGTSLGSGCTSGHGVCGIGRGSLRSLIATVLFMMSGAGVVFVMRHVLGRG